MRVLTLAAWTSYSFLTASLIWRLFDLMSTMNTSVLCSSIFFIADSVFKGLLESVVLVSRCWLAKTELVENKSIRQRKRSNVVPLSCRKRNPPNESLHHLTDHREMGNKPSAPNPNQITKGRNTHETIVLNWSILGTCGIDFLGYLGSLGSLSVFGRWNDTEYRVLRDECECAPCSAAFLAVLALVSFGEDLAREWIELVNLDLCELWEKILDDALDSVRPLQLFR